MLARNKASLARQTDPDYEVILIVDDVGRGVPWANKQLAAVAPRIKGRYVFVLDDDDEIVDDTLIMSVKLCVGATGADLIIHKMDHGPAGIFPDAEYWGKRPVLGHFGMSAAVMSASLYRTAITKIQERRAGDIYYYQALYDHATRIEWEDRVISRVQRISWGKPE